MKAKHFPIFLCILLLALASLACEAMAGGGDPTEEPDAATSTPVSEDEVCGVSLRYMHVFDSYMYIFYFPT